MAIEVKWYCGPDAPPASRSYLVEETAIVDGKTWYSMLVTSEVTVWLKQQDPSLWYLHKSIAMGSDPEFTISNMFDVHEELMLIIKLKFNG